MYIEVVISNTEPSKKEYGMIWLDINNGINILKVYDGVKWTIVHF